MARRLVTKKDLAGKHCWYPSECGICYCPKMIGAMTYSKAKKVRLAILRDKKKAIDARIREAEAENMKDTIRILQIPKPAKEKKLPQAKMVKGVITRSSARKRK